MRLITGALRICSCSFSWPGKFGCDSDHVTFSFCAARTAFHSFGATTARKFLIQTICAPGMSRDRAFVHRHGHGASDVRADHPRVKHARQAQIGDHVELREDFLRQVLAPDGLANDFELHVWFQRCVTGNRELIAVFAVPFDMRFEIAAADQIRHRKSSAPDRKSHAPRHRSP